MSSAAGTVAALVGLWTRGKSVQPRHNEHLCYKHGFEAGLREARQLFESSVEKIIRKALPEFEALAQSSVKVLREHKYESFGEQSIYVEPATLQHVEFETMCYRIEIKPEGRWRRVKP